MRTTIGQFCRFGMVGTLGFCVDSAALYLLMYGVGANPYGARVVSFLLSATVTWALNRVFTFRGHHGGSKRTQWAKFLAANSVGGMVNYGTFAALIGWGEPFSTDPVLAVAAGSLAGMMFNFTASKAVVFRPAREPTS